MDYKKQKRRLYAFSFTSCLRITDAVWVVLLVGRGYALWQVGLAEGIFHIVSLLCEIPSGMAADLLGRRRTLAVSGVLGVASALFMASSTHFAGVCLSMAFSALACNFISGTQEAIVYDSLLQAGQSKQYVAVNAVCSQLESLAAALSSLASFLSGVLGFVGYYLADAAIALTRTVTALSLAEPVVTAQQAQRQAHPFAGLPARFRAHVAESVHFLVHNPTVTRVILADACITLPSYLTLMYLQQRLSELGLATIWLGVPVLAVDLCRMLGTAVGSRLHPGRLLWLYAGCAVLVGAGVCCAGAAPLVAAVGGAMLAAAAIDAWYLHGQKRLNDAYPSDQRATLVSVNSMVYSLLMIVASPVTGALGDAFASAGAGLCVLGAAVALSGCVAGAVALVQRLRGAVRQRPAQ